MYSNIIPMINNIDVFLAAEKLLNDDLDLTLFYGTDHFVLLNLKLKPDKCLISISKLGPQCRWKCLLTLSLMVDCVCTKVDNYMV